MPNLLEKKLIRYADGDLPESERPEIERWLRQSPEARERLTEYKASLARVTDGLAEAPREVIEKPWPGQEGLKPAPRLGTLTRAAVVAATVVLLAALIAVTAWEGEAPEGSHQVAQPQAVMSGPAESPPAAFDAERDALLARIEALERRAAALESRLSLQETQLRISAEETAAICRAMGKRWERQFGDSQQAAHRYDAVLRDYPDTLAAQRIRQEANEQGA